MHTRLLSTLLATLLVAACADQATAPTPQDPGPITRAAEGWRSPARVRTGYLMGRDGRPFAIAYEVREGRAIWEGDVDIGPAGEVPATPDEAKRHRGAGPRLGVVTASSTTRWPGARVPYVIDPGLPSQWRVTDAIAQIEAATELVDFVPRTTETAYVRVIPSTGCSSSIGRVGSVQYVRLATGCTTGSTVHELLHALGMFHEHTRCDRDSFVRVNTANIQAGYGHNFTKQCAGASSVDAYDEGSIMHYPTTAFSVNGLPTIVSLRGRDWMMGQRVGMSAVDVRTVDWMY